MDEYNFEILLSKDQLLSLAHLVIELRQEEEWLPEIKSRLELFE